MGQGFKELVRRGRRRPENPCSGELSGESERPFTNFKDRPLYS